MRLLTTLLYGFAASLALVAAAAALIGEPNPDDVRRGGLTAATVLSLDSARTAPARDPAPRVEEPSS